MRILPFVVIAFMAIPVQAQTDTAVFKLMKKVEVMEYVFSVPEKWKNIPFLDNSSKDRRFDFTGVGIPAEVNYNPLTATFNLRRYECKNIRVAEDYILTEFTSYPDRVTPAGYNYEKDSVQIASGEEATLFYTHYYRRSKMSNFTRIGMIAYSNKRKAAYMFTVTYQYKDSTYAVEKELKLRQYALEVFKTLVLR